jgi:hypothetical protein
VSSTIALPRDVLVDADRDVDADDRDVLDDAVRDVVKLRLAVVLCDPEKQLPGLRAPPTMDCGSGEARTRADARLTDRSSVSRLSPISAC